jgi:hypothetical protein
MNKLLKMTALLLISNHALAGYIVKIPLEIQSYGSLPSGSLSNGSLPNGSIIFGNGSGSTIPTTPTDPESDCYFDLQSNFSAYADGYLDGNYIKQAVYLGKEVINGKKGVVQFTQDGIDYAQVCFGSEGPIYKIDNNEDENWNVDDCRYNINDTGSVYYWKEIDGKDTYSSRKAFTEAKLGSLGTITYQTSGLYFPPGYINTSYGQIQPEDNPMIGRGSVYFYRGNLQQTSSPGSGNSEYLYSVCKMTVN